MSKQTSTDTLMKMGLAGVVVVLAGLAWVSAFFGEMLTPTGMPWTNFTELVARFKDGTFAWPQAATYILIVLALIAFLGIAFLTIVLGGSKPKDDGLPRYKDLEPRMGKKAALAKARQSLHLPEDATEEDIIVPAFKLDGKVLYVQHEDSMWVYAPQRSGKTLYIAVGIVLDAPGPVLATSTKNDLLMYTAVHAQAARPRAGL